MKRTPSPHNLQANQGKQISSFRYEDGNKNKTKHKSLPVLRHIKVAVKKVAGIFTALFGQRKAALKATALIETRRNDSRIRGISCKFLTSMSVLRKSKVNLFGSAFRIAKRTFRYHWIFFENFGCTLIKSVFE